MKSKAILCIAPALAAALITLLFLWWWQATRATKVVMIPIPNWVMGETNKNVSYSAAIGKSQVRPGWTLWKATYYPNTNNLPVK